MILRKKQVFTLAAPAVAIMMTATLASAAQPATAPNITFTASGTFATPPISGADTLKLAGEPFAVTITVNSATKPYKTGKNYAIYNKLKLTGQVYSGLVGPTPVPIASGEASIEQLMNPNVFDQLILEAPIKVTGIQLSIKATVNLPWGTIPNPLLHPFSAVTMSPSIASMSYSDSSATTDLAISSGTVAAVIP